MEKNNYIYIKHIRKAIAQIETYTKGLDEERFTKDTLVHDAVLRQLMIIGEAARRITNDFQNKHSEVPWRVMENTRNKIVHEYFGIRFDIVWDTIKNDLPALEKILEGINE